MSDKYKIRLSGSFFKLGNIWLWYTPPPKKKLKFLQIMLYASVYNSVHFSFIVKKEKQGLLKSKQKNYGVFAILFYYRNLSIENIWKES